MLAESAPRRAVPDHGDCPASSWSEADRLSALERYAILDTGREDAFDDVAALAADLLDAPIAVVNFIAADRQWFKAEIGIGRDSLPLDVSICRHAILQPGIFVVPDLTLDPRFLDNPLVAAVEGLRFYAGALLETSDGLPLGTVCVLDTKPRPEGISPRQARALRTLATQTMAQLELRRTTRALGESRERLAAIFSQAPAGLSEIGFDGRFIQVNDALCVLLERPRELLLGLGVAAVTHPDDIGRSAALLENAVTGGKPFTIEKRYLRPDGSVLWARSSVARIDDAQGRPLCLIAATIDMTQQRAAQDRLLDLNADLERQVLARSHERGLIWQLSHDLLSVIDLETATFDTVNPAWTATLGWTAAELEGRPYADFVHPDDLGRSAQAFTTVRGGRAVLRFENRYRTKEGGWRWLSWMAVPEDGKLYSVTRDMTAEREQAQALAQTQEALRQAQKMEAMGQLTGGVAHDFNNLLTPIVGVLDLLQQKGLGGAREQRLIGGALQSAERAAVLVQRLLAFARRQPLRLTAVDIGQLVAGMGDLVSSTTGPQIQVVVEVAPDLPPAKADPNQIEMALLNLAVNARDAMPGGGTLRISATAEAVGEGHRTKLAPGAYIRLSVADTGTGMDAATLARAVEPFFSTKGIGKGTGLGLSMVHGLAIQLGGALTLQSRRDLGTQVELWLPCSAGALDEPAARAPAAAVLSSGTVLLVDDEELVRLSTAEMLEGFGYAVAEARSAEEAMRLVEDGLAPDLLVTDHLMPGIAGTELARWLQARAPGVRVLVVSGYAEIEGIDPDLPRLAKPFRTEDLAAAIQALDAAPERRSGVRRLTGAARQEALE